MSVQGISGLRAWIGEMEISQEGKSLAKQYVDDLEAFVAERPDSKENHMLVSQARIVLGLWARPSPVGRDAVIAMLAEHAAGCTGAVVVDKRGLAGAVTKAATWPAAVMFFIFTFREEIGAMLAGLAGG